MDFDFSSTEIHRCRQNSLHFWSILPWLKFAFSSTEFHWCRQNSSVWAKCLHQQTPVLNWNILPAWIDIQRLAKQFCLYQQIPEIRPWAAPAYIDNLASTLTRTILPLLITLHSGDHGSCASACCFTTDYTSWQVVQKFRRPYLFSTLPLSAFEIGHSWLR